MIYYCGCCGGDLDNQDDPWCARCKSHVGPTTTRTGYYVSMCNRTYLAQHGRACPFQESGELAVDPQEPPQANRLG